MPNDTVRLTGFKELHDALGQLPKATERAVLRRVAIKALEPFVDEAIPANEAADAIKRLNDEFSREKGGKPTAGDVVGEPNDDDLGLPDPADVEVKIGDISEALGGLEGPNDKLARAFEDMAQRALSALDSVMGAIKGGNFLDILTSVADAFLSLGGANLFGKPNASTVPFGGFRAAGGPVSSGKGYVVGENGPEFFQPDTTGFVIPTMSYQRQPMYDALPASAYAGGGRQQPPVRLVVTVDEGKMFRTTIRQEAGSVATAVQIDATRRATRSQRQQLGTGVR